MTQRPTAYASPASVRAISVAVLVALMILAAAVAGGISRMSALLERTSAVLIRDSHSVALITETELNLLAYQQISNLRVMTREPDALAEAGAARDDLQRKIRAALVEAHGYAESDAELDLVRRAEAEVEAYFDARERLEAGELGFEVIWNESRKPLTLAAETLGALRALNDVEVEGAYQDAAHTSAGIRIGAIAAAAIVVVLLAAVALWARRTLLRPIVAIRDAIERYREGDDTVRISGPMPRELLDIASAFDAMSATLARRRGEQIAFLAGIAHELRNPLFALRTSSAVLSHEISDGGRPALAVLERQLCHLSRLVDELLDIGRSAADSLDLEVSELDLCESVRAVLDLYAPVTAGHRLEIDLPQNAVVIRGDSQRIEQVVGNLVSNAIKYSPDGGAIRVQLSASEAEACIAVSDQGVGIRRSEIHELFAPFRRRSTDRHGIPGAGLGLFVVKRIVNAHGGTVEVESEPGKGSTFRVRLPRAVGTHAPVQLAAAG
jgi:signal transduction histidine kinase